MVSNTTNLTTCTLFKDGKPTSTYLVSGHNELVLLTNCLTNETEYKVYDKSAAYGFVTCLKVSANLLAIGFSSGTVLVVDLDLTNATTDEDNAKLVFA